MPALALAWSSSDPVQKANLQKVHPPKAGMVCKEGDRKAHLEGR